MSQPAILEQVSPLRFNAVKALRASPKTGDHASLHALAEQARQAGASYGRAPAAQRWQIFAEALDIAGLLVEWQDAVNTAAVDADRFLRAARSRLRNLRENANQEPYYTTLLDILGLIEGELTSADIKTLRNKIASVPLPVAVYADPMPERSDLAQEGAQRKVTPTELAVAFVEFKINGTMAERLQHLRPRETHDLDIAVRVSRWPEQATSLVLSPMSIEPESSYDLPTFVFDRPKGEPPFFFQRRGRMIIHAPQNFKARPFEFNYAAEFQPTTCEQPVSIAGQRTLRLSGSAQEQPITGYPGIDRKLISLRDRLRIEPLVPEQDLDDLLCVLVPLGNLMGQAVQDAIFPDVISEAEFQKRVRGFVRQYPSIGVNLEEQAQSAGGRTDLSYRGIRIELKSETEKNLLPEDCKRYASQPASYAVGTNRRVAVLCVLDCSPKTRAPFPAEEGLFVYALDTGAGPIYIITCLVQGNLPKPSSLSRTREAGQPSTSP